MILTVRGYFAVGHLTVPRRSVLWRKILEPILTYEAHMIPKAIKVKKLESSTQMRTTVLASLYSSLM